MIKVLHYDAFTDTPGMGNPAGIVLNADNLSEKQMQSVAAAAGYNETAFVLSSGKADIRLRFFTPGHEMDLCGHATVASVFMMKEHGILKTDEILLETNAGILPVSLRFFSKSLIHQFILSVWKPYILKLICMADISPLHFLAQLKTR